MTSPIRPTDTAACDMARDLITSARSAALAVIAPNGDPLVTRVAFGLGPSGQPLTLISALAAHTTALRQNPACSLLIGDPQERGDPLTHPRLTVQARAEFVEHATQDYAKLAAHYLRDHPKSKLYIGFADFSFALFRATTGHLNGGFGQAFTLTPQDMGLPI